MKDSATETENTQNMDTSENEPTLEQNVENRITGATSSDTVTSADVCQDDINADSVDLQCDENNSLSERRLENLSEVEQDNTENVCEHAKDPVEIPSDKPNDSGDITKKAIELVNAICSSKEGIRNSLDDIQITSDDKSRQLELNRSTSSEETSVPMHESVNVRDNIAEHPSVSASDSVAIAPNDKDDKLRIEESSPIHCSDSALVVENTGTASTTENVASPVNEISNGTDEKEDADVEKTLRDEPAVQDDIVPDTEDKTFSDDDHTATETVSENTVEINNQSERSGETREPVVSPGESNKCEQTASLEETATSSEVTETAAISEKDATETKGDDMTDVSIYFTVTNLLLNLHLKKSGA